MFEDGWKNMNLLLNSIEVNLIPEQDKSDVFSLKVVNQEFG